jgi:hypothetical protein
MSLLNLAIRIGSQWQQRVRLINLEICVMEAAQARSRGSE